MTRTTQWFLYWVYRPEVSSFEVRQSTSTQLEPGTKKDTGSEGFSRVVLRIIDLSFHVSVLLYECRVSPGYSDILLINDVLAISPHHVSDSSCHVIMIIMKPSHISTFTVTLNLRQSGWVDRQICCMQVLAVGYCGALLRYLLSAEP